MAMQATASRQSSDLHMATAAYRNFKARLADRPAWLDAPPESARACRCLAGSIARDGSRNLQALGLRSGRAISLAAQSRSPTCEAQLPRRDPLQRLGPVLHDHPSSARFGPTRPIPPLT